MVMHRLRISKGWVIALASYEKSSFIRFFVIYVSVFLLLFSALGMLYYYKEHQRLFQEQKVQNRLAFSECEHLNKALGTHQPCTMAVVQNIEKIVQVYYELLIAFGVALVFIVPMGYFLARVSLRPIRRSIETIDSFINSIVHDINTPLSIIKLNAQSMQPHLQHEVQIEKNRRVLQGIRDIESLEEQLLFSLKADRYTLNKTYFDLFTQIQERMHYWNGVRQSVTLTLEGSSLLINADVPIVMRMIDNIVFNAIKFSPRNETVYISLKDGVLCIEDRGKGIKNPKEVFNKYYREDAKLKGLGLGLFIVHSVAILHGITLKIESKVGSGTRFYVDFSSLRSHDA